MNIKIHKGAGINTVTVDGHVFDLNAMSAKQYNMFRRQLKAGWAKLKEIRV